MKQEELNEVVRLHNVWLKNAREGRRANLSFQELNGLNLSGVNLSNAILEGCSLIDADVSNATLNGADLYDVNFLCSNISNSSIKCANLSKANLSQTNLSNTDLSCSNLTFAFINYAELKGANLSHCELYGSNLSWAKNVPDFPMDLPDGEFIAYKKVLNKYIVKLKVLEDSKRSRSTTEKCRCDKALVLQIQNLDGTDSGLTEIVKTTELVDIGNGRFVYSYYRKDDSRVKAIETVYKVGEIVYSDKWDENRWKECSSGIHFFLDRKRALEYKRVN